MLKCALRGNVKYSTQQKLKSPFLIRMENEFHDSSVTRLKGNILNKCVNKELNVIFC